MLNFRKLKQGFSPNIVNDGKKLYEKKTIQDTKLVELDTESMRISSRVKGAYNNTYECEIEIDRFESEVTDSNCDCPYSYDCQHLAALLFYLEEHLNEIVVAYSKEADLESDEEIDEEEREELKATFREAEGIAAAKQGETFRREMLNEYIEASKVMGLSPFFVPHRDWEPDKAELALIFHNKPKTPLGESSPEIQLALRLPFRSKPLNIQNLREFLDAIRYQEPLHVSGKRFFFVEQSFDDKSLLVLQAVMEHARFIEMGKERTHRTARIPLEAFGTLLAQVHEKATSTVMATAGGGGEGEECVMPCLYEGALEQPLKYSLTEAQLRFSLEYLEAPSPKILLQPAFRVERQEVKPEEGTVLECAAPGLIYQQTYYRFPKNIKRAHLKNLAALRYMTIPQPLFGTFVENSLPQLQTYAEVSNPEVIEQFVTLPFVGPLEARCELSYLDGELDAALYFCYDQVEVPAAPTKISDQHALSFITEEGVVARNLTEEREVINDLFQGFLFQEDTGLFVVKTAKKIVEFMTETVPRNQGRVDFRCPENLLDQFVYDDTQFVLDLRESKNVGFYELELKVKGQLKGLPLDVLWECVSSKKTFVEIEKKSKKGKAASSKLPKTLVLNLERLAPVVQLFDELGVGQLNNHVVERPLWSLASISADLFDELPVAFTMTEELKKIQDRMLGATKMTFSAVPKTVKATLRNYQKEGVHWLEKLRTMHLNSILADDMGLGKTLQAIVAITQYHEENPNSTSLVVCPTSLTYNWKEELSKFNGKLRVVLVDGPPAQRKKLLNASQDYDVVITSYTLLQKDIDVYKKLDLAYCILDEAQHIKNRSTRNAKSVKELKAAHRLILTGTPIENSLEELWSLFDFLMPGFLSSYERFVEKYVRNSAYTDSLDKLRKKVSPFILRRMKEDVLDDLPPVSEITYHCYLSPVQQELYKSYAASAREELTKLVEKEGFNKVRIHVLATLTRLKQICCHPAIFAKDEAEEGDSAKYEMLMELLQTLNEGHHKTVIFSQYTRMLSILRQDLIDRGIAYSYLDGTSKNRLEIVNEFNEDPSIPVFLVSLKAGGSGLNLVGADTVIHYDMWWNPAVQSQATDRVHRIGQQRAVSSYKLVTLGTIEEKIVDLQNRKKGLVKKVVSDDDEALAKLTWEEVLDLLQV